MAQITPPWQGRDIAPINGQRIIACIGELGSAEKPHYIIATYVREVDNTYLLYPSYTAGRPEYIGTQYLLAWQALDIEGPQL